MSDTVECKRGDTLQLSCVREGRDITNTIITATARRASQAVSFIATKTAPLTGGYKLTLDATGMELGDWEWDIQYSDDGVIVSVPRASNFVLTIVKDVT